MKKIAFATCTQVPHLYEDDLSALPALQERGFQVIPAIWEDEKIDWSQFDAVIIRSTWYYWLQYEKFRSWITTLKNLGLPVWNPPEILEWNSNKLYLKSFEEKGIPVVPTLWIEKASTSLEIFMKEKGWSETVIKPVISGGAHLTHRVSLETASHPQTQSILQEIWKAGPAMVQPFLPEILSQGEYSFLFYGGKFSHAVIKKGKPDEFRIQRIYGGTITPIEVDAHAIAAAQKVVDAVDQPLLYARVDMIRVQDQFLLMELEATEPNLFFLHHPQASARFALALEQLL